MSSRTVGETTDSRWFKIAVFVVSGFFVGFSIANVYYYNRIRTAGGDININGNAVCGVTPGQANAMLWINAILLVIAGIIFLWSLYRLIVGTETRQAIQRGFVEKAYEPGSGFYNPRGGQVQVAPAAPAVVDLPR